MVKFVRILETEALRFMEARGRRSMPFDHFRQKQGSFIDLGPPATSDRAWLPMTGLCATVAAQFIATTGISNDSRTYVKDCSSPGKAPLRTSSRNRVAASWIVDCRLA